MGYTGGDEPSPTYESVCARNNTHTEALKLAFDPTRISYEQLMQRFVDDPRVRAPFTSDPSLAKPQYRTAVWAQDEAQAETARRLLVEGGKETIPVLPKSEWHDAEDYHDRRRRTYPTFKDLPDDDDDDDDPWGTAAGPGTSIGL